MCPSYARWVLHLSQQTLGLPTARQPLGTVSSTARVSQVHLLLPSRGCHPGCHHLSPGLSVPCLSSQLLDGLLNCVLFSSPAWNLICPLTLCLWNGAHTLPFLLHFASALSPDVPTQPQPPGTPPRRSLPGSTPWENPAPLQGPYLLHHPSPKAVSAWGLALLLLGSQEPCSQEAGGKPSPQVPPL